MKNLLLPKPLSSLEGHQLELFLAGLRGWNSETQGSPPTLSDPGTKQHGSGMLLVPFSYSGSHLQTAWSQNLDGDESGPLPTLL